MATRQPVKNKKKPVKSAAPKKGEQVGTVTEHSEEEALSNNWEDKFVRRAYEDPSQLLAHDQNWKVHPRYQQAAMEGTLEEIGWVDEVKVDVNSGKVFNGHMRCELAISRGERVPVAYYNLTPEDLNKALASFDAIGALAITDKAKYGDLTALIKPADKSLQALLDHTAGRRSIHAGDATKFLDDYTTPEGAGNADNADNVSNGNNGSNGHARQLNQPGTPDLEGNGTPGAINFTRNPTETHELGSMVSVDGAAAAEPSADYVKVLFLFQLDDKKLLFEVLNPVRDFLNSSREEKNASHADALMHIIHSYQSFQDAQNSEDN